MAGPERWRVFCGIDVPDDVRQRVMTHSMFVRREVPEAHASWSRESNFHLTLKFLGDVPQASVQNLSEAASRAVAGLTPFTVRLEERGVFPPRGSPRVLWLGVDDLAGKLGKLHARLEDEAARLGFQKEPRPFHPHLTLARLRKPQHAMALASAHQAIEFEPAEIGVSELLVIRSELSSEGSKYTVISRHALGGH
jgi:2'-5' RNA ligase